MKFGGLDNRHDPAMVGGEGLVVSSNVDHRDNGALSRRKGQTITGNTGTSLHSLWGAYDESYGYQIDGNTLIYLDSSLNKTTVGTMPSSNPAGYVECPTEVAVVTTSGTRFVRTTSFWTPAIPTPLEDETQFKALSTSFMGVSGAYHYGRLYVFGTHVQYSLPYNVGCYDRRDYILPVGFTPTVGFSTNDGLWVAGANACIFLQGSSPKDFQYNDMLDFGVHCGVRANPADFGLDSSSICYVVSTTRGAMLLMNEGTVTSLSKEKYYPPNGSNHSGLLRYTNGTKQFLVTLTYGSDAERYNDKAFMESVLADPQYYYVDNTLSITLANPTPSYT